MTIADRMAAALARLEARWKGARRPKALYLRAEDWAEFEATNPPSVRVPFGNNPVVEREDLSFDGVPVRPSRAASSRLYDHTTTGHPIPDDPDAAPAKVEPRADIPAEDVFAALDALSRTRALTDPESRALEAAMRGRCLLTKREAARLGIKRKGR